MKRTGFLKVLCSIFLCAGIAGAVMAQQPAPDAKPAASDLAPAAEALKRGDEARAWDLYSQNQDAFAKQWRQLDPAFAVWVPDQLRKQKRFKEALAACDMILLQEKELRPENAASVILTKGDVYRDQENFAAARMEYQALDRNKAYAGTELGKKAKFRIIDILRVTKDYETALEMVERLKDISDPAVQAEAYYLSAKVAFDRESYPEAREAIQEVKKRVPEHVEALFLEAELNLREDRLQDPELEIGTRVLTTYLVPGRQVLMKMQDRNLAVVRGGAGVPVKLRTVPGGDEEVVALLPSPRDPTLFRGTISTKLGDAVTNNMHLEVTGSDVVTYNVLESFQKENNLKYEPKRMVVASDGDITATSGEFLTAEERDKQLLKRRMAQTQSKSADDEKAYEKTRDTTIVRPGNEIRVQVIDFDRDVSAARDKVAIKAETSTGDSIQGLDLTETEVHSGIFRGIIPTTNALPKASASDSEKGKTPAAVIRAGAREVWSSASDGKKGKWLEVDLMAIHPLAEASLDFVDPASVKAASLFGSAEGELVRLASTAPSREEVYGYVDLKPYVGDKTHTAAFMYTEVTSEAAGDVVLKIGSCQGVDCWVNGAKVHSNPAGRLWKPEEDTVKAKLKAGINGILLRISQTTGPWGASMTVLDANGKGLPSLGSYPPAKEGVVTRWYVFERPSSEEIQVAERIPVDKAVRIGDKQFRWVVVNVAPAVSLSIQTNVLKAVFQQPVGLRRLRWVFDDYAGQSVSARSASIKNKFGAVLVPADTDFSAAVSNRVLELGPGDQITVSYKDERRVSSDEGLLVATMHSGFYNAAASLEYETIGMDKEGKRQITYDTAIRYRPGATDHLVARVVDYDSDISSGLDKVKVLAETSSGEKLWMEGVETEEHSGVFLAILKLGAATGGDAIKVAPGDTIRVSYIDKENSDGRIEKMASVIPATDEPPELVLYQTVLLMDEEQLGGTNGPVVKVRLPPKKEGGSTNEPVVTSVDTSLVFKVIYPAAALSSNATFTAQVATERELEAARKEQREPKYLDVPMRLANPADAEFAAEVMVRAGEAANYADEQAADEEPDRSIRDRPLARLYARNNDIITVRVKGGAGVVREGRYRLASDATMAFTDRKYKEPVPQIYLGDFTYLRMLDRDMDVSDGLDEVKVNVSSKSGSTAVTLVETLPHSGLFTGRLKTEPATAAAAVAAGTGSVIRAQYGEAIRAVYEDQVGVVAAGPRKVTAAVAVFPGADGAVATFTKIFTDPEIAVKTRLLTAEALFELAKEHRDGKQVEMANSEIAEGKTILEEAISDYPDTKQAPHAEFLLANLAQELENYEEALERYNKVLSNWPDSEYAPRAQFKKAICLEKMDDDENAMDAYVELTYSYPKSPLVSDVIIRLGQRFYVTKQFDVAGKIFGNFQQHNPDHPLAAKALFLAGQSYMKGAEDRKQELGGQYDGKATEWLREGIGEFDRLVMKYEDKDLRSEAMYWLAECYAKVADMKNAYQTYKKLTWDYPETKWAKFARGQLVQNARAFEVFEREE